MDSEHLGAERTVPMAAPVRGPAAAPPLVVSAAVTRPAGYPRSVVPPAVRTQPRHTARPRGRVVAVLEHVNLPQVVCWQVAVLTVVLAAPGPWPIPAAATAGAAILLVATGVRVRGHWCYELAWLVLRFHLRARRHDLPGDADGVPALLGLLSPGSTPRSVATAHGSVLAISHERGLTAMIRPRATVHGFVPEHTALLPEGEEPTGVRTVFHSGPSPGRPIGLWFAVHAERTVEAELDDELILVLRNGLRRVRRVLERAGLRTEPVARDEAFATITGLVGGHPGMREDWRFVHTGALSHACFRLDGWHRVAGEDVRRLVPLVLGGTVGVAATLTVTSRSAPGRRRPEAVLRLAAPAEVAVDQVASGVAGLLASAGVGLTRLDGGHLPALAASLPLAPT